MKPAILQHMKKMAVILAAGVLLGILLLTLVFLIPEGAMWEHVSSSAGRLIRDEAQPAENTFLQYIMQERESYTDAIMVQNALEKVEGRNAYEHAMWAYHYDLEEGSWNPEATLKYRAEGGDISGMFLHQYSRYWHGYLVYLKPLLLLFTWEQVVWIGGILQLLLMALLLFMAIKTKKVKAGVVFVVSLLFMKPVLMGSSLAMGVCWVITLGAVLLILAQHDEMEQKDRYPEFFLMIGILVAYFDFLTYPVVALGFPLGIYFLIKKEEALKQNVVKMLAYSTCWGLGYLAMWGMKWVIADITLQTGTIKQALGSILGWTEAIGGRPRLSGAIYTISLNFKEYDAWFYPVMAVILVLADAAAFVYACRKVSFKRVAACCVPFLLIALLPFAWYMVVQHHSGIHVSFTFRIISVAVLAFGAMGLGLLQLGRTPGADSGV